VDGDLICVVICAAMRTFCWLGLLTTMALGCENTPSATSEGSTRATASPPKSSATSQTAASAPAPTPTASAAPSASESAAPSASAEAPKFPSETPSASAPSEAEFEAQTKEIAVRASGEQQCSTKVLQGWFEMKCGAAGTLVRPTKFDGVVGFANASGEPSSSDEPGAGTVYRFVAALPADGSPCQVRFFGKGLHEIFLTMTNTEKGWKGELTGKKPAVP
jgi:hypothetical protein